MKTIRHKKRSLLFHATTVMVTLCMMQSSSHAVIFPVPGVNTYEIRAAHQMQYVCRHLTLWQGDIEAFVNTQYNNNAALFQPGDATRAISDISYILGTVPTYYYTSKENNCPTINIQLGASHTITTGGLIPSLNQKKIKSVATCNSSGLILKWDTYTDMSYQTVNHAIQFVPCYGLISTESLSLT